MATVSGEAATSAKISEKVVSEVWRRQLFVPPIRTVGGQALDVIYAGRRCCDHGPDFRGALIAFDGELRRGDVEVHVRAADWRSHGHQHDSAYAGVILHVVMWPPGDPPPYDQIGSSPGNTMPVLCVHHHALAAPGGLASLLESTPYTPFRCRAPVDRDAILGLVDAAGGQRLREKAAAIEGELSVIPPEEVLYRAIMAALGYSRNSGALVRLAENVPLSLLMAIAVTEKADARPLALEAFLLGKTGLLPRQSEKAGLDGKTVQSLQDRWNQLAGWDDGEQPTIPWELGRVRPANHPARRLAGAARLLAAATDAGLRQAMLAPLFDGDLAGACRHLERALMGCGPGFESRMAPGGHHLIGRARAAEIVANAILPFSLAYGATIGDRRLARRARELYATYTAPSGNEFGRYMADLLFGTQNPADARTIQRQQGLLHLYKRWCRDKWCSECPVGQLPSL